MKLIPEIPKPKLNEQGMYSVSYTKEQLDYLMRWDGALLEDMRDLARIREMVIDEDDPNQSNLAVIQAVWHLKHTKNG